MHHSSQEMNMHEQVSFRIRFQGTLDKSWFDYFSAQSATTEKDQGGNTITILISDPMDQSTLVGLINRLNDLGIPIISVDPIRTD